MLALEGVAGGAAADVVPGQNLVVAALAMGVKVRVEAVLLERALPYDVDVLNVNVPESATPATPWRLTRLSRRRYFLPVLPDRANGEGRPGYTVRPDLEYAERDSDVWTLRVARVVSVTPLSLDMTSRADFGMIEEQLRTEG